MPYVKKNLTPEQRSEIARKAQAARKNNRGGRPKGSSNKNPKSSEPTKTMTLREGAYHVYVKCAFADNTSIVDFMDKLADHLKRKNPKIFSETTPVILGND